MIFFKCYDSLVQVPFCEDESVQLFRVAFFQSDFLQNPYFSCRDNNSPIYQLFVLCTASQIIVEDFAKLCCLLRIYEINFNLIVHCIASHVT